MDDAHKEDQLLVGEVLRNELLEVVEESVHIAVLICRLRPGGWNPSAESGEAVGQYLYRLRTLATPVAHLPRPLVALFVAHPSKQGNGFLFPLLRPIPRPQASDEVIQERLLLLDPYRVTLILHMRVDFRAQIFETCFNPVVRKQMM